MKTTTIVAWLACALLTSSASAAVTLDLTHSGASGTVSGATFTDTHQRPTGTGVIGSFLRIQNSPTEQGYNTGGGTPFDDKGGISLKKGDLSVSDFAGDRSILLDLNEPRNGSQITLTSLEVFTSPTHDLTTTNISSLGTLRYSLGTGDSVLMNAGLNSGSGSGDVLIKLPSGTFTGAASTDAVYVYAAFSGSAGGFEEFALTSPQAGSPPPTKTPEPASLVLLPLAVLGLALRRRR